MIAITAQAGAYRKGLLAAAAQLSPEEAAIIADLERHGLQVPQLHDVLCGGHVLVDDPQLYEDWRFTDAQQAEDLRETPIARQARPDHR